MTALADPMHDGPPGRTRCKARSKQRDAPCAKYAIPGAAVCQWHGGRAPQVRRAAAKTLALRAAQADAAAVLAHEGRQAIERPVEELAELASTVKATMDALGRRVNALRDLRYSDDKGAEQTRAEVELWGQWIDRLTRLLEGLVRAGFEERRVRVEEDQAAVVAQVLSAALAEVGLSDRSDEVLQVVARRLEAVA